VSHHVWGSGIEELVMDKDLKKALSSPKDYSKSFSDRIDQIRGDLQAALGVPLAVDRDMNYSSSQRIFLRLDETQQPVAPDDPVASYELSIYISSRGKFFTYAVRHQQDIGGEFKKLHLPEPGKYWIPVNIQDVPPRIHDLEATITNTL